LIGLNEDVVNVPDENFLLVENRFESNEYDEKSSSDDEVFVKTNFSRKDNDSCLTIDIQRTMASHKQCVNKKKE
jgi:hypothetical protein